jgi:hypothetical protein
MRSFLNNLVRAFRSTPAARVTHRAPYRANVQVECLEDRRLMTSVLLEGGTTAVISNIAPNHDITIQSTGFFDGFRGLEVFDNGVLVNNPTLFNISNITKDFITVSGGDYVFVNDSNGMPFAQNTAITLDGFGTGNQLALAGSRGIAGNETYVAGGAIFTPGSLSVDNLHFTIGNAITTVSDLFAITGTLDVQTSGTNVVLSGANGAAQTLSGMGFGGGDTLNYVNKNVVTLEEYAPNALISLNATAFDAPNPAGIDGGTDLVFQVNMHGAHDTTVVNATPSNVTTEINTFVPPVANSATVVVSGNAGAVFIQGNASTQVTVGQQLSNGEFSTHAIQSEVDVINAGSLSVSDSGNVTTAENVTVTPSAIFGTGLFGNDSVKLFYSGVGPGGVHFATGQLADDYTMVGDGYTTPITIVSDSHESFRADVFVDPQTDLHLSLLANATPRNETVLDIHPTDVKVKILGGSQGVADVFSGHVLTSQILFNGFGKVKD